MRQDKCPGVITKCPHSAGPGQKCCIGKKMRGEKTGRKRENGKMKQEKMEEKGGKGKKGQEKEMMKR